MNPLLKVPCLLSNLFTGALSLIFEIPSVWWCGLFYSLSGLLCSSVCQLILKFMVDVLHRLLEMEHMMYNVVKKKSCWWGVISSLLLMQFPPWLFRSISISLCKRHTCTYFSTYNDKQYKQNYRQTCPVSP